MKKMLLILFVSMLPLSILPALTKGEAMRGMAIAALKGEVQDVSVSPIVASSYNAEEGMPFYLTDSSVSYSSSPNAVIEKREIATWSFYSNFASPKISIYAPPLKHATGAEVPYQLAFYYQFQDSNSSTGYTDGNLIVESGTTFYSDSDPDSNWNKSSSIAFTNRPIRFMLVNDEIFNDEAYPYGDYNATVTITILGGD